MTETSAPDVSALSFEDALKQLETIVQQLEQGNVPLEHSIEIYSRGEDLRRHCDRLLQVAETKVEKIRRDQNGGVAGTEPLDVD